MKMERQDTHPDLLPSQECVVNVSAEDASVLTKSGATVKVLAVAMVALANATKKTQASIAALLLNITIAKRTRESSSHLKSMLVDKGKSLRTGGKGARTDERGPKPCPPDLAGRKWLTIRQKYLLAAQYATVSGR